MAESVESELELEIDKIEALRNFEGALASISTIFVILSVIWFTKSDILTEIIDDHRRCERILPFAIE